jgi:GNAT superfamily N-acetyltransferase
LKAFILLLKKNFRKALKMARKIYDCEMYYILSLNLTNHTSSSFSPPSGVNIRWASRDDIHTAKELWRKRERSKKTKLFDDRFSKGYRCCAAWIDGKIIGIDWLTDKEDHEPETGLHIKLHPGSCYGLDLHEHPYYKGQGIGLAILSYNIQETKNLGFQQQYSIVSSRNESMLMAVTQLFGYKKIGTIKTKRFFNKPSTVWQIDNKIEQSGVLQL